MNDDFCAEFEDEQILGADEMNLIELMDLCSNLYVSQLEVVKTMSYRNGWFAESINQETWIGSVLSFSEQIFFKLRVIH